MAAAAHFRVVAVPLPRPESLGGRILGILDANERQWLKADAIAARLQIADVRLIREALSDLKVRGLVRGQPTAERAGRQPVWAYQIAEDLAALLPAAHAGKAAA